TDIDNNDSDDPRALRYNAAFAAIVRTVRDRYEIPAQNNRFFTEAIKRFGDMAREKSAARNERYLY
ncbi:hypothetical protein, partial [Serratia marcescens]|uniref:hypothetical protein n=1 Tax=Serratia marcescens TaxID=615 RepID=UPI001954FA17